MSTSELMKHILEIDGGLLYMTAISLSNSHLLSAVDINDEMESANKGYVENIAAEEESNKCKKYIMTKKYKALDELNEDNDKQIFFDKKLDPTRYDIIEEYQDQRNTMKKKDFKLFMIDTLKKNVGLKDDDAEEDVEAMLDGKRTVKDGQYAVLEEEDSPPKYYVRKDNRWAVDDTIPSIHVDNNDIFCNIQPKCFKIKQDCADMELSESVIKHKSLEEILNEFDIKYEVSKEQLIQLLTNRLQYFQSYIGGIIRINNYQK